MWFWTVLIGCTEQEPETLSEDECVPRELAPAMPQTARGYAELCSRLLGEVPTADCGEGVRIPITVDGVEVLTAPGSVTTLGSKVPVTWAAPFEDKREST